MKNITVFSSSFKVPLVQENVLHLKEFTIWLKQFKILPLHHQPIFLRVLDLELEDCGDEQVGHGADSKVTSALNLASSL